MDVVEMDCGLFAVCPQDSEIDPISLKKDDLSKYSFSTEKFLEKIRTANGIGGVLHEIYQDFFYFGYAIYESNRVGFVFGFTIAHGSVLELTGLKRLCVDDEFLVIFSPASVIEDVTHKRELYREKVVQTSFVSSLDFQTYKFSIKKILSGSLKKLLLPAGTGQKIKSNETPTTPKDIAIINRKHPITLTGFVFLPGQVFYDGKDLGIGGPLKREVFETLHSSKGRVVSRKTLLEKTTKAVHYIGQINKRLEAEKIPFHIYTITGEGYKLDEKERS